MKNALMTWAGLPRGARLVLRACCLVAWAPFCAAQSPESEKAKAGEQRLSVGVVAWDCDEALLAYSKRQIADGNADFRKAYEHLLEEAEPFLTSELQTVTTKKRLAPSGDKHDYMSMGTYWWPNPDTPDGLPFIRRDGYTNEENYNLYDKRKISIVGKTVRTLALAYYFSGDEKYAERAARQVRTWFLDEATRMNPNMNHGQAIPGRNDGRAEGIIDMKHLVFVLDGVTLLKGSKSWTAKDDKELKAWLARYREWLETNALAKKEREKKNNHATWYDVQLASMLLYMEQPDAAKRLLKTATRSRIVKQISEDGAQPEELSRTNAWSYSNGNLIGFYVLAEYAEALGVDLWTVRDATRKPALQAALDFLIPSFENPEVWTYQQINGFGEDGMSRFFYMLRLAHEKYKDERYKEIYEAHFSKYTGTSLQLVLPTIDVVKK